MSSFRQTIGLSLKGALVGTLTLAIYGITAVTSLETASLWKMSAALKALLFLKIYALIFPAALICAVAVTAIARRSMYINDLDKSVRGQVRVLGLAGLLGLLPYCILIVFSISGGTTLVQAKNVIVTLALPTAISAIIGAIIVIREISDQLSLGSLRKH
jgi:hypothetical protein